MALQWVLLLSLTVFFVITVSQSRGVKALYAGTSKVVSVSTQSQFDKEVKKNDGVTIVEFYAPWCGHCKNLAPEYDAAAAALAGVVKLVAVDADANRDLAAPYGIQGFPTIKVFRGTGDKPADYNGQRTRSDLIKFGLEEVSKLVKSRTGAGSNSSSGGGKSGGNPGEPGGGKDVITLTASNFKSKTATGKNDVWAVEFFAPWCGHCKQLAPVWAKAAENAKGMVKFGAVDCDEASNKGLCAEFGVQGFPTIKAIQDGKLLKDYNGARDVESITTWAMELGEKFGPLPEVPQLFSKTSFKDHCTGKPLCMIGLLPHIIDSGAEKRNSYIELLQKGAKKFLSNQWSWLWVEVGQQEALQDLIGVSDTPSVVALSPKKKRFSVMKGAFSLEEIGDFSRGLQSGRIKTTESTKDFEDAIADSEQWDGKDGQMEIEEEFDLSELMNDD